VPPAPSAGPLVALAGGTGAAKLVRGLARVTDPARITVIGNTGDDLDWWGLHVSPDLDTLVYALAGFLDPARGWGIRADSFHCLDAMRRFGRETWFQLGDRDLATHLHRTLLLRTGMPLSAVTRCIAEGLGVTVRVLPMSDDPVRTELRTPAGWLTLEEFFVRERCAPEVEGVAYRHAAAARPAPGVLEAIQEADAIIVCCSNPVTSIGPILAVPGVVDTLAATSAPVVAVSPIVRGRAVSGPAGKLLAALGLEVSPVGVADAYRPWLDALLVDAADAPLADALERRGVRAVMTDVLMPDAAAEARLASAALATAGIAA
jgi:LPPG:FO 2-phospho-L-lactate transferase